MRCQTRAGGICDYASLEGRVRSITKTLIFARRASGIRSINICRSALGVSGRSRPSGCRGSRLPDTSLNQSTRNTPRPWPHNAALTGARFLRVLVERLVRCHHATTLSCGTAHAKRSHVERERGCMDSTHPFLRRYAFQRSANSQDRCHTGDLRYRVVALYMYNPAQARHYGQCSP